MGAPANSAKATRRTIAVSMQRTVAARTVGIGTLLHACVGVVIQSTARLAQRLDGSALWRIHERKYIGATEVRRAAYLLDDVPRLATFAWRQTSTTWSGKVG